MWVYECVTITLTQKYWNDIIIISLVLWWAAVSMFWPTIKYAPGEKSPTGNFHRKLLQFAWKKQHVLHSAQKGDKFTKPVAFRTKKNGLTDGGWWPARVANGLHNYQNSPAFCSWLLLIFHFYYTSQKRLSWFSAAGLFWPLITSLNYWNMHYFHWQHQLC